MFDQGSQDKQDALDKAFWPGPTARLILFILYILSILSIRVLAPGSIWVMPRRFYNSVETLKSAMDRSILMRWGRSRFSP